MSVLLHISDPHFGTEQAHVMAALLDLSHQQRPDLLVLCGDITQRACADQFRRARAFVDQLHVPLLAIPGNHDIPLFNLGARVLQPYARFSAAFGQDLAPEHESPDMLVLGVNTTRWYRHKNGEVSSEQIERVARRLASASPRQLRVVVVHHPVAVTKKRTTCCAADTTHCITGLMLAPISCWAATSICPTCWRLLAWGSPCGRCRPAPQSPAGFGTAHRTRSMCCAGAAGCLMGSV